MEPDRRRQISDVYYAALLRPEAERSAFLRDACGSDDLLRHDVESLLADEGSAEDVFEPMPFPAATSQDERVPEHIGRYRVAGKLGSGGMGIVYRAYDPKLQRNVAIKVVSGVSDPSGHRQLLQEARAASALNHPHICTIHEVDEADGVAFIVMEHIDGQPLTTLIPPGGLPAETMLRYSIQIADALAHAHHEGIVHRDVKAANVLITQGRAKVLDFGLAKRVAEGTREFASLSHASLTEPGRIRGTLSYMAPERLLGEHATTSSDVWALGVLLYQMATGVQPFPGKTTFEVISAILDREPAPLSGKIAPTISAIVGRCLEKDPAQRYQQAGDVHAALDAGRASGDAPTPAWLDSAPQRRALDGRRRASRGGKIGFASAAVIVALAGTGAWFASNREPASTLTDKDTLVLAEFTNATGERVFDGTLREALAVQLEQSPLLRVLSEAQVRQTLQSMGRSPDDRISDPVAHDICVRRREKAMLAGSIASLGSSYAITLVATDCQSGETLAREQVEAAAKERVLKSLATAATSMRGKLGESLASIQKLEPAYPAGEATTPSLEAFDAYAMGNERFRRGQYALAIPFYQRAVALDPNFPMALWALSGAYGNTGDSARRSSSIREAFAGIDRVRVSQLERLLITAHYHLKVTGDLHKAADVLDVLTHSYPRYSIAHIDRGIVYGTLGDFDKAASSFEDALRQEPAAVAYSNLTETYALLDRFDDARVVAGRAVAEHLDSVFLRHHLLWIALMEGDSLTAEKEVQRLAGTSHEVDGIDELATQAIVLGQRRKARELLQRASALARAHNRRELSASLNEAAASDLYGECQVKSPLVNAPRYPSRPCADPRETLRAAETAMNQRPADTFLTAVEVPVRRAVLELRRNRPDDVIALLAAVTPYERAFPQVVYLRGQAYLRSAKWPEAAAEFQKIVNRKASSWGAWYPLAHVGLARASSRAGDVARARKAYADFLELWKGADQDIPILIEARREYSALQSP